MFRNMDHDLICSLDVTSFSTEDALNIILQRSRILSDQPKYNDKIKAWTKGESEPLIDLISKLGRETIIRRTAALVLDEYQELRPIIETDPPKAMTDIGCGYAFFDLFIAKDFGCAVNLIDIETNGDRHFGFESTGAGYSNLNTAVDMMIKNGVPAAKINTCNPTKQDIGEITDQDLVVSFISCGFHYPWTTYETFFRNAMSPNGRIILDIRKAHKYVPDELSSLGTVSAIPAGTNAKAKRLLIVRN